MKEKKREEEKMSWYFKKITTEEKEKMEKMVDIINEKIKEETLLSLYMEERRMSLFLKEKDKVKLHYSPDTTDIDAIEFELHNAFVSAIEAYDLKYLSVEYDDGNIVSAVFYLKDKTTGYHIDF